eukprot:3937205-Rhodomonas_salina.2
MAKLGEATGLVFHLWRTLALDNHVPTSQHILIVETAERSSVAFENVIAVSFPCSSPLPFPPRPPSAKSSSPALHPSLKKWRVIINWCCICLLPARARQGFESAKLSPGTALWGVALTASASRFTVFFLLTPRDLLCHALWKSYLLLLTHPRATPTDMGLKQKPEVIAAPSLSCAVNVPQASSTGSDRDKNTLEVRRFETRSAITRAAVT